MTMKIIGNKQAWMLSLWLLLCSCGTYQQYERPDVQMDSHYRDVVAEDTTSIGKISWKDLFSDAYLHTLIEQGLAGNTDLKIAALRISEAQASLMVSKLAFLPAVSLQADGTIRSFDKAKASQSYNIGVGADWDIDISGKRANQLKSDRAELYRMQANKQAVHSRLIAAIAEDYYALLALDKKLEINERTLRSWDKTIQVLQSLKKTGNMDEAAINQAEANRLEVEANLLDLRKLIANGENAMSSLLGVTPGPVVRGDLSQQQFESELSLGIPLQLLSNRPDVRMVEYDLEKAFYTTNRARAAFYPDIKLAGTAGWTNAGGQAIVNPGGMLFSAVASLAQPLFNRGANVANLKISKAQQEEALLLFQQKLLDAGIEVNDALKGWQTAHERLEIDCKRVEKLRKAVRNTQLTMVHGSTTYLEVLTAEQSLLQAELDEVTDRYEEILGVIKLYYALGGGSE